MASFVTFGNDLYTGARSFDFVGKRRIWYAIAAVVVVAAVVVPILRGGFVFGIEFRGGSEFQVAGVEAEPDQQLATDTVVGIVADASPRVSLVGDKPVSLFVHARRTAIRPLFAAPPQQSDYKASWQAAASGEDPARGRDRSKPFAYFSLWEALRRRQRQRRKNSLRNRKWFQPLVP